MSQKQYWKDLNEFQRGPEPKGEDQEFKEKPALDLDETLLGATAPRRDFLKFLGFSTVAATLAASCEMPVRRAIPYAIKPEEIVPGVPNYYASTFVDGGDYCSVVIKTRDGRPIKVEGNDLSSITQGGTSARVQASVLNLYDKTRLRHPLAGGEESSYEDIDRQIIEKLKSSKGTIYLVTGTILSPTTKAIVGQFLQAFPQARHVVYDPVSYAGMILANEASFGKRGLPSYHFDEADTIFSLGADFLGTWLSPIEFAKQYSKGRKLTAEKPVMSRHYHLEPIHTITGAKADFRATYKPSQEAQVALALYQAIETGARPSFSSEKLNELIHRAAQDLKKGKGLVVSGSNDVDVQMVINAINHRIGAYGTTIDWGVQSHYKQGIDKDFVDMVSAMSQNQAGAVLIHGNNPVYDTGLGESFAELLSKVPLTLSFADRLDETAQRCQFVVPDHHYLESWGDAEPKTGYYSLMQPGIAPLFKTRSFQDSLLTWMGADQRYEDYWKDYWVSRLGSRANFDKALQDGVIEPTQAPAKQSASFIGDLSGALSRLSARKGGDGMELVVYQKVSMGSGGAWSNNPWLQEMPDPITKATWDNYICVSPQRAKELGEPFDSINQVVTAKRVLTVKTDGYEVSLPMVVVPGMHNDVVAIALGYGRDAKVGRAAAHTGKKATPFIGLDGDTFRYHTAAQVERTDKTYDLAITQTHLGYENRAIIHEYTLEEFKKDPLSLRRQREAELSHYSLLPWEKDKDHGHGSGDEHDAHAAAPVRLPTGPEDDFLEKEFRENGTLYPLHESPGIHWGMSIDLNSCIGCGACVIGCQAENNISVVGKTHVLKFQEMHWLRIDRYFSGKPEDPDSIQTIFQPMLCQHCDNAPCENVCPVSATNHSSEGLNQMAYNRCIGTKYCANNCPYKVRRFNWMDWNGADCFDDNLYEDGRRDDINDDLTRMVLNPDVTVRSRGVMEKCTFCVQRLQDAKLQAKQEGEPLRDGTVKTACQQACPTDAIQFGNVNDRNSEIFKIRYQQQRERLYYALEQLHVLPNVNYLSAVRNTDQVVAGNEELDGILKNHL